MIPSSPPPQFKRFNFNLNYLPLYTLARVHPPKVLATNVIDVPPNTSTCAHLTRPPRRRSCSWLHDRLHKRVRLTVDDWTKHRCQRYRSAREHRGNARMAPPHA